MIGDEDISKIIWKGIIKSEKDFLTSDIPKNATIQNNKNETYYFE